MKTIKPRTRFKRVMETIGTFLAIAIVAYGFLSLCNWSIHLKEWSVFSRFIMGAIGVIFLIVVADDF
jgi:hypothetical protein